MFNMSNRPTRRSHRYDGLEVRRTNLAGLTILAFAFALNTSLAAAEPTFPKDVQGQWHVLLGLPATQFGSEDEDTGLIGGQVTIEADRLMLDGPGAKPQKLLTADCKLLAEQRVDEKQRPVPGREAEAALSGKLTGARRLIWATSVMGLMHVKVLTSDPIDKGRYRSDAWGSGPDTLYLVLRRQPVPPRSTHDAVADSKRILGDWIAVAHYDDAFLKEPRLTDKRTFSITAERINELDDKGQPRRPPVGFWGTYRIAEPAGPLGAIDLHLESWAGGGAGLMGRTPSLYAFHGNDLLYIAYNETDKRPEDKRTRCERLRSDGNHNLFILVRQPTEGKN
jgi:hypothetical protein